METTELDAILQAARTEYTDMYNLVVSRFDVWWCSPLDTLEFNLGQRFGYESYDHPLQPAIGQYAQIAIKVLLKRATDRKCTILKENMSWHSPGLDDDYVTRRGVCLFIRITRPHH